MATEAPSNISALSELTSDLSTPGSNSSLLDLVTPLLPDNVTFSNSSETFNSTWNSVTAGEDDKDGMLLSLPLVVGISIGALVLVIILCTVFVGVYHRKRRKKLPTGKLKMGPRHAVQPEQYPGLFDDRDDMVSLSYINVHMPQPKRTKEEDIISLDSDGYLNSLENPMYECHPPRVKQKNRSSSCTEM